MDYLLTKMSEIIVLHSSASLEEILRKGKLKYTRKREYETLEPNLGSALEELISVPLIESKAESKGTEIPFQNQLFFASFTSRVEFDLAKTQQRNC